MSDLILMTLERLLKARRNAIASENLIAAFPFSNARSSGIPTAMYGLLVLLAIAGICAFSAEWAPLAEWRTCLGIAAATVEFPFALWFVVKTWRACDKPYRRDSAYWNTLHERTLAITIRTMAILFIADFMCQTSVVIAAGSRSALIYQDLWSFCLGLYVTGAISRSPQAAWRDLKRRKK